MRLLLPFILFGCCLFLAACVTASPSPSVPAKLTIAGWHGYMPPELLEAFQAETGIIVEYAGYDTQEEAIERLRQGETYDLMVMGNAFISSLVADEMIVPLNYANLPNARNISLNFRDLNFDPESRYSVIYQWGTTGLLVRTDLIDRPITRWTDLWDPALDGKILLWPIPRDTVSVLLKSLSYSINTIDPAHLEAALQRAPELAQRVSMAPPTAESAVPYLVSGEFAVALGWSFDAVQARDQDAPIAYIIPADGTILWFDCLVIPASSRNQAWAERFIDFFLRPEMSALVTNRLGIATANEAALPLIDPVLRADESIFPSPTVFQRAEAELALEPAIQAYHNRIWQEFQANRP
ncbi:ABC transporter substrate-binding protein [Chloroflexus sp.]|uniref:ABC transporter substrate-binding protein n=1 Tax=Chloroflexus sp. TaxID=1904827 RepID=UPI00262162CD|nr:spermidine/putrescine ABC transporter substrate-binding protein [uncultured Chloroflexus sp.]